MSATPTTTRIELPRLPGERAERYQARLLYVTMGADRSLAHVSQKLGKSTDLMARWSSADGWASHARAYDDQLAFITVQEAAARHRADLEAHRVRYAKTADELHGLASALLRQHASAIAGRRVIEAETGKAYFIPAMKLDPASFAAAIKGLLVAADLAAHALDIPRLQAALDAQEGRDDA